MSVSGHWEGRLFDVAGVTALIALDFGGDEGDVRGDFSFGFVREAGAPAGPQQVQTGQVEGTVDEEGGKIELRFGMTVGQRPVAVSVDGRILEAQPHAKRAILGCFELQEGLDTLTLEAGGLVLWQYEDAESIPVEG